MADKATFEKTKLNFARILVEIDITKPPPAYVSFVDEHDELVQQMVEWNSEKCTKCSMFGHLAKNCRKGIKWSLETERTYS